mgnify:CR=1 FL=1
MVVGLGVDVVEVARVERLLARHGDRSLDRVFSPGEIAYCRSYRRSAERFAGRFAAKEAILKALGTGLSGGIGWTDVEVVHEAGGRPGVVLHGRARVVADGLGAVRWWLSISHTHAHAMACAVAESA